MAERLVVELKSCQGLLPIHFAQVLSYLKASDRSLALLINFNVRGVAARVRTAREKQDVFAKVIVRCGSCHEEIGIRVF